MSSYCSDEHLQKSVVYRTREYRPTLDNSGLLNYVHLFRQLNRRDMEYTSGRENRMFISDLVSQVSAVLRSTLEPIRNRL